MAASWFQQHGFTTAIGLARFLTAVRVSPRIICDGIRLKEGSQVSRDTWEGTKPARSWITRRSVRPYTGTAREAQAFRRLGFLSFVATGWQRLTNRYAATFGTCRSAGFPENSNQTHATVADSSSGLRRSVSPAAAHAIEITAGAN